MIKRVSMSLMRDRCCASSRQAVSKIFVVKPSRVDYVGDGRLCQSRRVNP